MEEAGTDGQGRSYCQCTHCRDAYWDGYNSAKTPDGPNCKVNPFAPSSPYYELWNLGFDESRDDIGEQGMLVQFPPNASDQEPPPGEAGGERGTHPRTK